MSSTVSILLPSKRDTQLISRLRSTTVYPTFRARTNRFKNSFIPYCLCNYQRQSWHFILLFIVCLCVCMYLCNCFNPVFGWQNTINVQNFTLIGCLASEKFNNNKNGTDQEGQFIWPASMGQLRTGSNGGHNLYNVRSSIGTGSLLRARFTNRDLTWSGSESEVIRFDPPIFVSPTQIRSNK